MVGLEVQERKIKILSDKDLLELLPFSKTKFNALLKAGELPLVKIGKDYITTESAIEDWIKNNIGKELYYDYK